MRRLLQLLLLIAGIHATPVRAAGVFDLSWDACTGPITSSKTVTPGSIATIYATVTGQIEVPKGYYIKLGIAYGCPSVFTDPQSPPDAWRFDTSGCQAERLLMDAHPPAALSKTCPSFAQGLNPSNTAFAFFDGELNLVLATTGIVMTSIDPAKRYHLARFVFDQSDGVVGPSAAGTCGGLELPMCIRTIECGWSTMTDQSMTWDFGQGVLHTDGATPARPTTWGAIRGQYR